MLKYVNGKYIELTEEELKIVDNPIHIQIAELKKQLKDIEDIARKFSKGEVTKEEYRKAMLQRQEIRKKINDL